MVEMAIVLPLMLALLAVAYTGWEAMHTDIGITSAARAGAIQATYAYDQKYDADIAAGDSPAVADADAMPMAAPAALAAVNSEENTTMFQPAGPTCTKACVKVTEVPSTNYRPSILVVSITESVSAQIPVLPGMTIQAQAGATTS